MQKSTQNAAADVPTKCRSQNVDAAFAHTDSPLFHWRRSEGHPGVSESEFCPVVEMKPLQVTVVINAKRRDQGGRAAEGCGENSNRYAARRYAMYIIGSFNPPNRASKRPS